MRKFFILPLFLSGCLFFGSDQNNVEEKDTSTTDMNVDVAVADMGDAGREVGDTGFDTSGDVSDDTSDVSERASILVTSVDDEPDGVCPDANRCTFREAINVARIEADAGKFPEIGFAVDQITSNLGFEIDFAVEINAKDVSAVIDIEGPALTLSEGVRLSGLALSGAGSVGISVSNSEINKVAIDGFGIGVVFTGPSTLNDSAVKADNSIGLQVRPEAKNVVVTNSEISSPQGVLVPAPMQYVGEKEPVLSITGGSISSTTVVAAKLERGGIIIDNVIFESNTLGIEINVPRISPSAMHLPINITRTTIVDNQVGIDVNSVNVLNLGGSLATGNRIAGNTNRSLDVINAGTVRLAGNLFGVNATGKQPRANQEGPSFVNVDTLLIGEKPPMALSDCRNSCNLFGPTTGQFSAVRVSDSNLEFHGNFIGFSKDRLTVFTSTKNGLVLRDTRKVNISHNHIVGTFNPIMNKDAAAISFSGTSSQPTGVSNIIENNIFGDISGRIQRAVNFNAVNTVNIGLWDFTKNVVKYSDYGFVIFGNMDGGHIHDNTIVDNISKDALSIRAPNLKVTDNRLAGLVGLYLYGQTSSDLRQALNITVSGNVFNGTLGVGLRNAPRQIQIDGNRFSQARAIEVLQGTDDRFPDSGTVWHFNNTFLQAQTPVAFKGVGGNQIGFLNDIKDVDIGPNTLINSPIVRSDIGGVLEGVISVSGATVRLYEEDISGNITPSASSCTTDANLGFKCPLVPPIAPKYFLSAEAAIFEFGIVAGDSNYQFMVNNVLVAYAGSPGDNLSQVAEGLVSVAEAKEILVNHNCKTDSASCRIWVIVAPTFNVTHPGVQNLGIGTSRIQSNFFTP